VRSRRRRSPVLAIVASLLVVGLGLVLPAPVTRAASYPVLPITWDRGLLSNLSAPSVGPGGASTLSFRLHNPSATWTMSDVRLQLELYALNGYPGDAVGPVPVANAPVLVSGEASGPEVNVSVPPLGPNGTYAGSVQVVTSSDTPAGTYAVRTAVSLTANGSAYLFESRGWFSASAWANATSGPNGSVTLNASRLGVSGVVPETAVLVAPSDWPLALGALVAAGLVLLGLGVWLYVRRGPGSSSGSAKAEPPGATNAPNAFGTSRSSPGDSRSS
jgi:hypothetical protein